MALPVLTAIQLPPDGTGKVTGGFPIEQQDGSVIYVPATAIVNSLGLEIGNAILEQLERIADSLDELKLSSQLTLEKF
jgi:hypothetical protein